MLDPRTSKPLMNGGKKLHINTALGLPYTTFYLLSSHDLLLRSWPIRSGAEVAISASSSPASRWSKRNLVYLPKWRGQPTLLTGGHCARKVISLLWQWYPQRIRGFLGSLLRKLHPQAVPGKSLLLVSDPSCCSLNQQSLLLLRSHTQNLPCGPLLFRSMYIVVIVYRLGISSWQQSSASVLVRRPADLPTIWGY